MSLSRRRDTYTPVSSVDGDPESASSHIAESGSFDIDSSSANAGAGSTSVPWVALVLALFVCVGVFFSLRAGHKTDAMASEPEPDHSRPSVVHHPDPAMRDTSRLFTLAELRKYDGSNYDKALLLSFAGDVYDVSAGARQYGKQGAYAFAAGRDVSRGFCINCFQDVCLLPDLSGLSAEQSAKRDQWHAMFERTYPRVGFVAKAELVSTPAQLKAADDKVEEIRKLHAGNSG